MNSRFIVRGLLLTLGLTAALLTAGATRGHAQEGCPPGQRCNPAPCGESEGTVDCATEVAPFSPTADSWTYIFDSNNAIKISTQVPDSCPTGFPLRVDRILISQADYAAFRRDPQFADTVCNPTAEDGVNCVFFRVHGDTAPRACYDQVDYKIFWNTPTIQGNKHDWMVLRAPCEEFVGDTNFCFNQLFSQNITTAIERKPPVGADPAADGSADGMSDYIVAISTRHPHKGIPSTPF